MLVGEHLNLSYLSPYLDSLAPNFPSGVNFAVSGAMTLPQFVPFVLDVQVCQFIRFKNRSIELQKTGNVRLKTAFKRYLVVGFLVWRQKINRPQNTFCFIYILRYRKFHRWKGVPQRCIHDRHWTKWSVNGIVCIKLDIWTSSQTDPFFSCRNQISYSSESISFH